MRRRSLPANQERVSKDFLVLPMTSPALTAEADNARLTEMVMGLRDQMRLYGIKSRAGLARQNESTAEHYQIIELAMAGEEEALTNLLRRHIRAWEPIFIEALSRVAIPREPIIAKSSRGR
jgi:DNA-binding GntR family transcriptional regulator